MTLELHDIPGGEDAFELCAKFCYGITIDLSAHNFVSAICAAKFLQYDRRKTNSEDHLKSLQLGSSDAIRSKTPDSTRQKSEPESKHKSRRTKVVGMGSQIVEEGSKLDSRKTGIQTSRSGDGDNKGRQR